jgi:hypothetical protein
MSMYVELLSAVIAKGESPPLAGGSLSDVLTDCRDRLLRWKLAASGSVQDGLAYEVAYDSALVGLCAASGIDVDPERFRHPQEERARLEAALAESDLDLAAGCLPRQAGRP